MVDISANSFWLRWEQSLNQTLNYGINLFPRIILATILVLLGVLIGKIIAKKRIEVNRSAIHSRPQGEAPLE